MPSPSLIRTMMFLGEDQINGEECNHYQITDSERQTSFGYMHRGYITYGFKTIRESQQGFRDMVRSAYQPPLEDDFDVSEII